MRILAEGDYVIMSYRSLDHVAESFQSICHSLSRTRKVSLRFVTVRGRKDKMLLLSHPMSGKFNSIIKVIR